MKINIIIKKVSTKILIISMFYYTYKYIKYRNLPPKPYGNLPIIGHNLLLKKNPQEKLLYWSKIYGSIICCYFGNKLVIVLNDYETIKEAFMNENFAVRAQPFMYKEQFKNMGITYSEGLIWKIHRKFTIDMFNKLPLENIILDQIKDTFKNINIINNKSFNIHSLLNKSFLNIMCGIVFGKRFQLNEKIFIELTDFLEICFSGGGSYNSLIVLYPITRFIPFINKKYKNFKYSMQSVFDKVEYLLENHKPEINNYIDEFLKQEDESFNKQQLIISITNLLIGGMGTTSTTLRWALVLMIENPDVVEKIHQEIDENIKKEFIYYEDKNILQYTLATLMEIQRVGNIATLGGSSTHRCLKDFNFRGYIIPKDTYVAANFYAVHVNENIFNNPYNFDPTRFLDKNNKIKNIKGFIPFSIGKRNCLGETLAKMELFLMFSNIMKKYNFIAEDIEKIDSSNLYNTNHARSPNEFNIIFKKRN